MNDFDLDRLRKLCGMFGSAHDGEIANAARMADRMLREAGLAWGDVLGGGLPAPGNPFSDFAADFVRRSRPRRDEPYAHWRVMLRACIERGDSLSVREADFITSLMRRGPEPTERQFAWLTAIYDRVTA